MSWTEKLGFFKFHLSTCGTNTSAKEYKSKNIKLFTTQAAEKFVYTSSKSEYQKRILYPLPSLAARKEKKLFD